MQTQVVQFTTESYENVPPPSDTLRFTLFMMSIALRDWIFVDQKDIEDLNPTVTFDISTSGQYRTSCVRLDVNGQEIGSTAFSSSLYIGAGTFQAPLVITLGH